MSPHKLEFWIDVGGTFTDCIGHFLQSGDAVYTRHKLLSSGLTPGTIESLNGTVLFDPLRIGDPSGFWAGAEITVSGKSVSDSQTWKIVDSEDHGKLTLDTPLPTSLLHRHYEIHSDLQAPLIGIHYLLGIPLRDTLPPISLRLGTTRGTNALLTRGGAKTALLTTAGFKDILEIGNQDRPNLFELNIQKPLPLFTTAIEIQERIDSSGNILQPIDPQQVRKQLLDLHRQGIESLAICLLNAYANSEHEEVIAAIAREIPFLAISVSSTVSGLMKLVSRADTTVLDGYLNPVLSEYIERIRNTLHPNSNMRLLTSAGGLAAADAFHGKDSILSGPAGGVIGFSQAARMAGYERAIGFDMGGTSTDVTRFDGAVEYEYETRKAGVRIVTPMLAIETVAAGGGSICSFDGVKLRVGPASAGADPGPACYGKQGPLTVTDLNLVLGKIQTQYFPIPLNKQAALDRLQTLAMEIEQSTGIIYQPVELAEGLLEIANTNMTQAIRTVSVARGYDPQDYLLVSFGGAGSQHACTIAHSLNIHSILIHPDAGILSARGLGQAQTEQHTQFGVYQPLTDKVLGKIRADILDAIDQTTSALLNENVLSKSIETTIHGEIRMLGVEATIIVEFPPENTDTDWNVAPLAAQFHRQHQRRYGYTHSDIPLELATIRVTARSTSKSPDLPSVKMDPVTAVSLASEQVRFSGTWMETPVFDRDALQSGSVISGPAIIVEANSTIVIEPRWTASLLSQNEFLLEYHDTQPTLSHHSKGELTANPVQLEIYNHHFVAIARQMGITLQHTASSVNVRERLDFSCAIFTADGQLVVNAPHIPVHLGAMGVTIQAILEEHPGMEPGDVWVTNDPYRGGSHLPDLTVITPVFEDARLVFFTAISAHHAEIGGITPGSMPPFSKSLAEEGVLLRAFKLVENGVTREPVFVEKLTHHPYPSRSPDVNLADIRAQMAANQQGARDLQQLIHDRGLPQVIAYMKFIQDAAEQKTRQAITALPDGTHRSSDFLDADATTGQPATIAVAVTVQGDSLTVDFTGTSPVLPSNLNANPAIVTAAVMYVLRCLINEDIPLNAGVLKPVQIVIPPSLLNPTGQENPHDCPAIAGGNVETSQRIVDVLIAALQLSAASQGTMNNLLFGNEHFGYYETICGGAGATPDAIGASAVHTHMTNTRITDPEVLEHRYPVRLEEFSIRHGSGGKGKYKGGDGVVRRITFLQPLTVSLLTQRRGSFPPPGAAGGGPGQVGVNQLIHTGGREQSLGGCEQIDVQCGDQLMIQTPGGGAWGK